MNCPILLTRDYTAIFSRTYLMSSNSSNKFNFWSLIYRISLSLLHTFNFESYLFRTNTDNAHCIDRRLLSQIGFHDAHRALYIAHMYIMSLIISILGTEPSLIAVNDESSQGTLQRALKVIELGRWGEYTIKDL